MTTPPFHSPKTGPPPSLAKALSGMINLTTSVTALVGHIAAAPTWSIADDQEISRFTLAHTDRKLRLRKNSSWRPPELQAP